MTRRHDRGSAYQVTPERDGEQQDAANVSHKHIGRLRASSPLVGGKSKKHLVDHDARHSACAPHRLLHLLRRVVIFGAAILYLHVSISSCVDSLHVLRGEKNPSMGFVPYDSFLMAKYAGTTTMRESPLVKQVLQDATTPRSDTVYLDDATTTSFTTCTLVDELPEGIYTNAFQRTMFELIAKGTRHNITQLDSTEMELIAPVVDCTSSSIAYQDLSAVRFFYLMRSVNNHDDVFLFAVAMSVQEYKVVTRGEFGSAAVATMAFLNDLQATDVTHYFAAALGYPFYQPSFEVYELVGTTEESFWQLESVPADRTSTPKVLETACRTGFYHKSDHEQANIKNTIWSLSHDPLRVINTWGWMGRPVLRDSWAWTHCLHVVLAFDVLMNLIVLLLIIVRNARNGTLWIGDAFVSLSASLGMRSALVLVSWYLDASWALVEFCLHMGNVVSDTQSMFIYPSILRADLLALYFCLVAAIGIVLKERIDPALTIGVFYVGFESRLAIAKLFPSVVATLTEFVVADYGLAMSDDDSAAISPMRLWGSHELVMPDASFVAAALFPVFSTLVVIIAYVAVRKMYRFFVPEQLVVRRFTGFSENEDQLVALKRNLTLFEVATGAALQNRFGVVADYDNCLYIRGVKFATADGIYSSGYVIANGTMLLQTDDLVAIWLMKIVRTRFRNVYMHDVTGTGVKQQARLVYPELITVRDLLALNIGVLM